MGTQAVNLVTAVREMLDASTDPSVNKRRLYSLCNSTLNENPNPAIMQGDLYLAMEEIERICDISGAFNHAGLRTGVSDVATAARKKWDDAAEANAWRPQIDTPEVEELKADIAPPPKRFKCVSKALAEINEKASMEYLPSSVEIAIVFREIAKLSSGAIIDLNSLAAIKEGAEEQGKTNAAYRVLSEIASRCPHQNQNPTPAAYITLTEVKSLCLSAMAAWDESSLGMQESSTQSPSDSDLALAGFKTLIYDLLRLVGRLENPTGAIDFKGESMTRLGVMIYEMQS